MLPSVLRKGSINIYRLNLPRPDGKPIGDLGRRMFPSGAAVLITDGLLLKEPAFTLRILQWYRCCILPSKLPGSWKLIMRPHLKSWLKRLLSASTSHPDIACYIGIFEEYLRLVPADLEDPLDEHQTPSPDSPLITPLAISGYRADLALADLTPEIMRENDELLVKWFAEWSLKKKFEHRRFWIPYTDEPGSTEAGQKWAKKWRHMFVQTAREFNNIEHVDKWLNAYAANKVKSKNGEQNVPAQNVQV